MLDEPRRLSVPLDRYPAAKEAVPDEVPLTRAPPLCYVADDEQGICNMISYTIREQGIATAEFQSAAPLLDAVAKSAPDLIFLDLSLEGSDAVEALRGLALLGYRGKVQLISGRDKQLLNEINQIGQRRSLDMLPILPKPFRLDAVRNLIRGPRPRDAESRSTRSGSSPESIPRRPDRGGHPICSIGPAR